jgi:hypothetical protein
MQNATIRMETGSSPETETFQAGTAAEILGRHLHKRMRDNE